MPWVDLAAERDSVHGWPHGRGWHQLAYDTVNERFLLHGGSRGTDETWELRLSDLQWTRLDIGTLSKEHHFLVYDPLRAETWMAHGWLSPTLAIWHYSTAWVDTGVLAEEPGGQSGINLMGPASCWFPPLNGIVFRGGNNWDQNGTWLLQSGDGQVVNLNAPNGTGLRYNVQNHMCWCPSLGKALFFGGWINTSSPTGAMNDIWLFDGTSWQPQATSGTPPIGRGMASVTYHDGNVYVHGGRTTVDLRDLWKLDLTTWAWTQLEDAPFTQKHQSGWWVPSRGQIVYAGGIGATWNQLSSKILAYVPDAAGVTLQVPSTAGVTVV